MHSHLSLDLCGIFDHRPHNSDVVIHDADVLLQKGTVLEDDRITDLRRGRIPFPLSLIPYLLPSLFLSLPFLLFLPLLPSILPSLLPFLSHPRFPYGEMLVLDSNLDLHSDLGLQIAHAYISCSQFPSFFLQILFVIFFVFSLLF